MSRGKYSPAANMIKGPFDRNAYGEVPPEHPGPNLYNTKVHFGNYNSEGYDSYGYSAWNRDGTYADIGCGIDIYGHTEYDYLVNFDDDEFLDMFFGTSEKHPVVTDRGIIGGGLTPATIQGK